ncbi:hypothetical protein S7711_07482 [Stachybotrys chartarum IBT 7711]|uniref:AAA+ ATPase domain-containing protein n=1 Tax=Stachybotrys chartarum (strain CBS 109288 / IBT 7711) TaxID=1280523 RepID=A0A084B7C4_STACB|nr:hypothetical protein S7711_07482 [Stachybotrys chartarum IBT 7711]
MTEPKAADQVDIASNNVEKFDGQDETLENEQPHEKTEEALIKYRIEYVSNVSEKTASADGKGDVLDPREEPPVLEYVDVRFTDELSSFDTALMDRKSDHSFKEKSKGHCYIRILSPAVCEALRCVVDYFPGVDLSGHVIKVFEPYTIFVFYEKELNEYRERLKWEDDNGPPDVCPNRWAYKHIGIAQDFVRARTKTAVEKERKLHEQGLCTFDMLWLLFKPGAEVFMDYYLIGEYDPWIASWVSFDLMNGATRQYRISHWNMDADRDWVGPAQHDIEIDRFAGEKDIISLRTYPCEFLRFDPTVGEDDLKGIRQHFVDRGRRWYQMRRKRVCCAFDGFTTAFPRRPYTSLVMVDPIQYGIWLDGERTDLMQTVTHPSSPLKICSCEHCTEHIYKHAIKPRFSGYQQINPLVIEELTDDQYFLCDWKVESFLFKTRTWEFLHISGFEEPVFDKGLLERLVIKDSTKELIKNLTQMYVSKAPVESAQQQLGAIRLNSVHKQALKEVSSVAWSADFIKGKGEGLTFLLHGKPGVGKTYTAECIAQYTGRPLLSLTCSDIGVDPAVIEKKLLYWFNLAEVWGAIILVDEADIYMEQRQVQDVERNHLVAGFLRALEYFKGILFLTTNRVGTFDEAFISRIHIQIHYGDFEDADRERVWQTFFDKMEDEKEETMRIQQSAKDYIHRNIPPFATTPTKRLANEWHVAFQVAVALAEAQSNKDQKGRILIKSDHIRASAQMSRDFKDYLKALYKQNDSKRAAMLGNRYDAFGSKEEGKGKDKDKSGHDII